MEHFLLRSGVTLDLVYWDGQRITMGTWWVLSLTMWHWETKGGWSILSEAPLPQPKYISVWKKKKDVRATIAPFHYLHDKTLISEI